MTEYKYEEFISVWNSNHKIFKGKFSRFKRWLFPFEIVDKDKDTKEIVRINKCGWCSNNIIFGKLSRELKNK